MSQPNIPLPPGLTPDMMAAISAYLAAQNAAIATYKRPVGILKSDQIRGVDPAYNYQYREFPKALNPPVEMVNNVQEERNWRAKNRQPLPWENNPEGRATMEEYYRQRQYPAPMKPSQIIVHSAQEEKAKLAEWNVDGGDRVAYPRYLFHPEKQPVFVSSPEEEQVLGDGWYASPREAMEEAARQVEVRRARERHNDLMTEAAKLNVKFSPAWPDERIREAIDAAKTKDANKDKN